MTGITFQFQPILAADGKRLLAYETLVRRSMPDGTIEGPGAILPTVLRPDNIENFTRYSLEFAFARLDADPYLPALSVNLSPRQLELDVTRETIAGAPYMLRRRLMVELTEDSIQEHPGIVGCMRDLAGLGVRVFLDDVAPSSLDRLMILKGAAHGLKLDRSLSCGLAAGELPSGVAELIQVAHGSGMLLVAEGIEDVEGVPRIASRGIAYFQGFGLGEPWSEPRIARRRIVAPRLLIPTVEPESLGAVRLSASKAG